MSVMVVSGIVVVMATAYIGRKGWLAFHRAVGITPGKLEYVEPSKLAIADSVSMPELIQLNIKSEHLEHLPLSAISQIQRIDTKADMYQQYIAEAAQTGAQAGSTLAVSEEQFVLSKLLNTRLPNVLQSYHRVARHEARLSQTSVEVQSKQDSTALSVQPSNDVKDAPSEAQFQALHLLLDLLMDIESRLDESLQDCQNESLQELQAMRRYLKERKLNEH